MGQSYAKKKLTEKRQKGFTLIELLVVVAIISAMVATVVPNTIKNIEKGKVAAVEANYQSIKNAALNFYADTGTWPEDKVNAGTTTGPAGFIEKGSGLEGWNGPYLDKWPTKNPWGGSYNYRYGSPPATEWGNKACWIEMENVSGADTYSNGLFTSGAAKIIQDHLGQDTVRGRNENSTYYLCILIARDY